MRRLPSTADFVVSRKRGRSDGRELLASKSFFSLSHDGFNAGLLGLVGDWLDEYDCVFSSSQIVEAHGLEELPPFFCLVLLCTQVLIEAAPSYVL